MLPGERPCRHGTPASLHPACVLVAVGPTEATDKVVRFVLVPRAAQLRGGGSSGQSLTDFGHPQRRVTDLLLALNVAMFGLQMASGHSMIAWGAKVCQHGPRPIGSPLPSAVCHLAQSHASCHLIVLLWTQINPNIAAGEWYRLVSCTILHANLFHLYTNCSALNSLGPFVEASSGPVSAFRLKEGNSRFAAL